jgi:nucleotide-binding universal stress UspA family protein
MIPPSLQIGHILCPTDFSVFSSRAFRHALGFAHQFRARVKVVHVLPHPANTGGSEFLSLRLSPSPEQRERAEADMREFVELALGSGVDVTTEIRDGQPWREVLAAARELPADLVALGTHGRSGFERFLLGSVTEKLLALLPCPTLTVCHEERRTWEKPSLVKRLLCATDFSPAAVGAVAMALTLAEKTRAEVTLVQVIDGLPERGEHIHYAVPEIAPLRKVLEEEAAPRLRAAAPDFLPNGLKVAKRMVTGRAHEKILEIAAEERADLIVLGARGHGLLGRLLFGSTSGCVVREATCPVVTVPRLGRELGLGHVEAGADVQASRVG